MKISENFKNGAEAVINKTKYVLVAALVSGLSVIALYLMTGSEQMFVINAVCAYSIFALVYGIASLALVGVLYFGKTPEYRVDFCQGTTTVLRVSSDTFESLRDANKAITDWESQSPTNSTLLTECWDED